MNDQNETGEAEWGLLVVSRDIKCHVTVSYVYFLLLLSVKLVFPSRHISSCEVLWHSESSSILINAETHWKNG
jgi:hypothetical protein